jgi:methyl-accepting chemotaxis protein
MNTTARPARTILFYFLLFPWAALSSAPVVGVAQPSFLVPAAAPSPIIRKSNFDSPGISAGGHSVGGPDAIQRTLPNGAASAFPFVATASSIEPLTLARDGLLSLAGLLVALNVILGKIQKREVSGRLGKEPEYVTREEFGELKRKVDEIDNKLDLDRKEILHAGEDRARKIHERVDDLMEGVGGLREDIGELRGELKHMSTAVHRLSEKKGL